MKSAAGCRQGQEEALTAARGTISRRKASGTGAKASPHKGSSGGRPATARLCGVCLRPLPPGAGAKFCSSRHRLMAWWLRELAKALHVGMADGLRAEIRRLGEVVDGRQ